MNEITLESLKKALENWKRAEKTARGADKEECHSCIRALNIRIARWECPLMDIRTLNRIYR